MILSKDVLVNNILTEISDNSNGQISPYDIRHNLLDIVDSVHLLTIGKQLNSSNFGTPSTRSTRVGEDALSKINLAGYFSIDNTAVGYSSLKANYQGIKNTAIGSHALFCNIYGEHNVALGYSSLGGNTVGIGNVGLGNYSLNNNKGGNFNIAIGHGAGYYLTNNTHNKLFIASHPVDSGYICNNPNGSGLTPLVYGDLSELKLGIAVNSLVDNAVLQIGGNAIPSSGNIFNLGASGYRWDSLFTRLVDFDNDVYLSGISGYILSNASILPSRATDILGSLSRPWASGYFNNITVNGLATFGRFVASENCNYFCHTINLANPSSGNIGIDGGGANSLYEYSYEDPIIYSDCGLPSDLNASGAGITINTSGTGYLRTYSLLFSPPDNSLSCLQVDTPYSRSSWQSNISLHLDSGAHLRTDRVIFPSSINIVNSNSCFGIFSRNENIFLSKNDILSTNANPSGYLAGVGNVNFYAPSGSTSSYITTIASPESGVVIKQRLLTGIKAKSTDPLNNNLDKLRGFELQYIDDAGGYSLGPTSDRLVIGSYNNTSEVVNALTLMKNNQTEGICGITNLTPNSKNIIPSTSLNIRSASNAIARITAENQASTISALQLLGGVNCLYDGFEASYRNGSGIADLSMFKDSGKSVFLRFYENNTLGLFTSSGSANEMFTIGDSFNNDAVISIYRNQTSISPTANYGKLYIKPVAAQKQSDTLMFMDATGNSFDLIHNKFDSDSGLIFTDGRQNTFAGVLSPNDREWVSRNPREIYGNTGFGFMAGSNLSTPQGGFPDPEPFGLGNNNTLFGAYAGRSLISGSGNIAIGSRALQQSSFGFNNIVIGNNALFANEFATPTNNNIVIGHGGVGSGIRTHFNLLIGSSQSSILLHGSTGPSNTDKFLSLPSGGKLIIYDLTNTDSLELKPNYIDIVDRGGNDFPNNTLSFRFTGNNSADLFALNHAVSPMTNNAVYENPIPARPYAQLNGDLKLRGAIRFSDHTSLSSTSFLRDIDVIESGLISTNFTINGILSSFVEGYVDQQIDAPLSGSQPTSGILYLKNKDWNTYNQLPIINRDSTSVIHSGAYVIAIKINDEFRPLWVSSNNSSCSCCK